jgi:hypothetical protein
MIFSDLAKELIDLKNKDLKVRQRLIKEGKLFKGYNAEMEKVHLSNAKRLQEIISQIGYPNIDKVGIEASQAAWLIIQHAISQPDFMKKCLALAHQEAENKKIDYVNVAFLSDRIAMYENRPQSFGTQFVGDENGELIPYPLDNEIDIINQRRRGLGLNTVDERLKELKHQTKRSNLKTKISTFLKTFKVFKKTKNPIKKEDKESYDNWRRKVGWIK